MNVPDGAGLILTMTWEPRIIADDRETGFHELYLEIDALAPDHWRAMSAERDGGEVHIFLRTHERPKRALKEAKVLRSVQHFLKRHPEARIRAAEGE